MTDYNCTTISDPFQNATCLNMQDNILWKNQVLDFSYALIVCLFVFLGIWVFSKIVIRPLLNLFRYV